jgi:protein phosphatase
MTPDKLPHLFNEMPTRRLIEPASPVHRDLIFEWGGLSHSGAKNAVDEDCFFLGRFDRSLEPILTNLRHSPSSGWQHTVGYVAIVADGMGGLGAGEVASQASVATLLDLVLETPDWIMRYDEEPLAAEVSRRIATRLQQVDGMLDSMGGRRVSGAEIGSTVTIFATVPPYGIVAHVGNSRAYLVRGGTLYRLTTDHTVGPLAAEAGIFNAAAGATHRAPTAAREALGVGAGDLAPDVQRLRLESGDRVLLCTDGLTDTLSDDEMRDVVADTASPAVACKQLVALALERGAPDNVTAVLGRLSRKSGL